jgi:dihydroorotate dehydrogenase (fumarate)
MSADLSTTYLGLELRSPVVVSACPLTEDLDTLKRLEEAGAAAVVFPSLFEEQIEHEELDLHGLFEHGTDSFAESLTYLPEFEDYNVGPEGYLRRLQAAKRQVSVPVIASLNGCSPGGWVRYGRLLQDAGADALELNIHFIAADIEQTSEQVEQRYLELVELVRDAVTIPLAVKVSPFFSAFANMAQRLVARGADGLVLFNRFVHADLDLESLSLCPRLALSERHEARLPMTWIALLHGRIQASLAATSGVHEASDALKLLLVGADVTMVASTIYRYGVDRIRTIVATAYERVNYMKTLASFTPHRPV